MAFRVFYYLNERKMEITVDEAKQWVKDFLNATETVTRGSIRGGISLTPDSEAKLQRFEAFIKEEESKGQVDFAKVQAEIDEKTGQAPISSTPEAEVVS